MPGASPPAPAASETTAEPNVISAGPQRYGRYILIDRLGAGGMAEVFRALVVGPENFQRVVVVKRILPHLSADPNFVRMFIAEATICGRLNHPNIIHVHEFGKVEDHYFIAMEYVQGCTLNAILARLAARGTYMPAVIGADIARQVCLGLAYAHALTSIDGKPLGVVHRDVTPSNVMVAYTGGVKVLDFGIARVAGEIRSDTDAGKVKGKSAYLAPEQISADARQTVDGRVDVFATGIILHEALCCKRLFKAGAPVETMRLIRELEIPRPSTMNPDVPPALDDIVMKALERDPARRWQSAGDMADALEGFLVERRYASQELPKWLRTLFAQEATAEVELALPEQEIAALLEGMPAPAGGPLAVQPPAPGWHDGETPSVVANERARQTAEASDEHTLVPPRTVSRGLLAGVGVALVGVGVGFAVAMRPSPPRDEPAVAAPPAPAPPAPAPPAPPVAAVVTISVTSAPPGAAVVDASGAARGVTPATIELPRGADPITLRLDKAGHVPESVVVVPDADKPVSVVLSREAKPRKPHPSPTEGKIRNAVPLDPFAR